MKEINQIDKLISSKMEGFEPMPPAETWQAIQGSLQQFGATSSAGAALGKSSLFKGAATWVKVALVSGTIGVGAFTAYYFSQEIGKSQQVISEPQQAVAINQEAKAPESKVQQNEGLPVEQKELVVDLSENEKPRSNSEKKLNQPSPKAKVSMAEPKPEDPEEWKNPIAVQLEKQTAPTPAVKQTESRRPATNAKELLNTQNEEEPTHKEPVFYTVITPNGDGSNDEWVIEIEPTSHYHLQIFDNRGTLLFESFDRNNHWKGLKGSTDEVLPEGTYAYILNFSYLRSEKIHTRTGIIKLLR